MQRRQVVNKSPLLLLWLFCLSGCALTQAQLIRAGSEQFYELQSKVNLDNLNGAAQTDAASYNFKTQLKIKSVWHSQQKDAQLLEVQFIDSTISAPGKKSPIVQRSITKIPDRPFYISLKQGQPDKVIAHTSRDQSLLNLERGIASLLQLKYAGGAHDELDVSGRCKVFYNVKSSTKVEKTKTDCAHWDLRVNYRSEQALGVAQHSQEHISYELSAEGELLRAESTESHRLALAAKTDVGSLVHAKLILQHVLEGEPAVKQLEHATLDAAIESLLEWYRVFELEADVDGSISEIKGQTLKGQLSRAVKQMAAANVGKSTLAQTFAQLLPVARHTKQAEFLQLLGKHDEIAPQLLDLLGAVQTFDAHNATFAYYYDGADTFQDALDLLERYLQSLAVGTHPERAILEHLFAQLQLTSNSRQLKLRDSMLQTLATLTRQSGLEANDELLQQLRSYLLDNLADAKCVGKLDEIECQTLYIRALQNLQDVETIDVLLQQALSEKPQVSVAALQSLKAFPVRVFSEKHRQQFAAIFYQKQRRFDSSARTLALDVLLALRPSPEQLGELVDYLSSNDRQFEIKTYVLQKLRMLAEQCPRFRALFEATLKSRAHVHNYHVLGQKGLTTVLSRQISQSPAFNESLLSTQEVYQGILKRGSVEFLLQAGREQTSSFKLGIYTSGLGSIIGDSEVSDGSDTPADDELNSEEAVTAGMEISVLGAHLRPLVFFTSQVELMGHVWGSTASESTPAYQATTLAQDHEQYIILNSGATLHWRVLGAKSVDLNGKVNYSIWNRNAQTEILQNTGSSVLGHIAVGFTYAQLVQDFTLTHEPKLSLQANLDFYSGIKLCMQLQRLEQLLTHESTRSVTLQSVDQAYTKYLHFKNTHKTAGCTFALNQKNNEMCNMILDYY